jgi:hypothetical protein
MPENYHMESIVFHVAEVNLPFNAIIGRPTLYQFMAVAHYGYLVLKMPSPNDIIKIREDRSTHVFVLEKLAGGGARGYHWPGGAIPGTVKLVPARLFFYTPRAALRR